MSVHRCSSRVTLPGVERLASQSGSVTALWLGHVALDHDVDPVVRRSTATLGMRRCIERNEPTIAVLELRGGTHLVLVLEPTRRPTATRRST